MFSSIFNGDMLRLAPPQPEDQAQFAEWSQDADYMRMLDDDPVRPQSAENYAYFSAPPRDNDYYFHLRTLDGDNLIGFVALFAIKWRNQSAMTAVGIGDSYYRGIGYGRDALQLILRYGFAELGLHRISLTVLAYNTAAIKAYEHVGFVHEGTQRQAVYREGQRHDLLMYAILREEWLQTRA